LAHAGKRGVCAFIGSLEFRSGVAFTGVELETEIETEARKVLSLASENSGRRSGRQQQLIRVNNS
jgi:hypothetical protein